MMARSDRYNHIASTPLSILLVAQCMDDYDSGFQHADELTLPSSACVAETDYHRVVLQVSNRPWIFRWYVFHLSCLICRQGIVPGSSMYSTWKLEYYFF